MFKTTTFFGLVWLLLGCDPFRGGVAGPIWDLEFQIGPLLSEGGGSPNARTLNRIRNLRDSDLDGIEREEGRHFEVHLGSVLGRVSSEEELFLLWRGTGRSGRALTSAHFSYRFRDLEGQWKISGEMRPAFYQRENDSWRVPIFQNSVLHEVEMHRFEVRLTYSDGGIENVRFDFKWRSDTLPIPMSLREVPISVLSDQATIPWAVLEIQNPYDYRTLDLRIQLSGQMTFRQSLKHSAYLFETNLGRLFAPLLREEKHVFEFTPPDFWISEGSSGTPQKLIHHQLSAAVLPHQTSSFYLSAPHPEVACEHYEVEPVRTRDFRMWASRVRARDAEMRFADRWMGLGLAWSGRITVRVFAPHSDEPLFEVEERIIQGGAGAVDRIWEKSVSRADRCRGWVRLLRGIAPD